MRDQYDVMAEYGLLQLLVDSWPVNFPAVYGFRMPNAVDWRSIHHHYTGLGKAHTSCETVHDFWVRAWVYTDTFLSDIWLGLNTVCLKSPHSSHQWCTLQMKGQWESKIKVWFQFMYSQKWNYVASLFPKQNYNVLSPNFHIHVSVSNLYIPRLGLPILLQPNRQTDPGNI